MSLRYDKTYIALLNVSELCAKDYFIQDSQKSQRPDYVTTCIQLLPPVTSEK
jgi:hypothetical protein